MFGEPRLTEYHLLDSSPGLLALAPNRCRQICGQSSRPWKSYAALPEVKEGVLKDQIQTK